MAARALKSAYEIARDARVLENQVLLQSLELPQVAAHAPSLKPKPQKRKADLPAAEPSRSSRRLRKEGPELGDGEPAPKLGGDLDGEATRGGETYETSYWSSRKAKYEELFRREREEGVELPKRATYEHTVGRLGLCLHAKHRVFSAFASFPRFLTGSPSAHHERTAAFESYQGNRAREGRVCSHQNEAIRAVSDSRRIHGSCEGSRSFS